MGLWDAPGRRWVYFAERDGLVKIGYSANVDRRMRQLRARLLAVMPGGPYVEWQMHQLFAEYHAHGEWFHPGYGLVGFIEGLRDDPEFSTGLPEDYRHAEGQRIIAEWRAEAEEAKAARAAAAASPSLIDPVEDRRAAAIIGAALLGALATGEPVTVAS